jgi:valyl-tRNA synthetase
MDTKDLPKAYEASGVEAAIYGQWEKSGFFDPDKLPERNLKGEPYCIMMPPPNVTGVLHLGHALENALMDTMVRFQRMRGKRTLLVPGTDHAAIATQSKVEKILMEQGMKQPREELGREKLVAKIREFAEGSKATILSQIRTMGTSCDWSRLAYTFDDERNKTVKELFVRMYNDGLIYRGYRVVNWTVKGQSTCSDDEIIYMERPAKLYTMKYGKDFPIVIATTRPETKLGDTAVAVHPTDERYKDFVGKTFTVEVGAAKPLSIKVIADEEVDPAFGTGAVGVTPAHSPVDFAMYEKQKAKSDPIGIVPVIGTDGRMTAEAGEAYAGLTTEEAREKFVAWLQGQGLLIKEEEIVQNVGTSDRYGDVIESIPMTQWWLDMNKAIPERGKTLRDLMREALTTGLGGDAKKKVAVIPERFTKLYLDRVENLRDWCLSRQLWWGHRIPVWYRGDEIHVGTEAPQGEGWEQDPDTLDTWFSSGSWCLSTLGWPEATDDLKIYHPTSWMQMGYEILYLWLMRMVLMSAYALDDIPFKDAYIHGILRDQHGKKFSKSSGNGIDPVEVAKEYGCDALRVSLLLGISPGNDSRYYDEKIESGRNFTNKLWNISRFIMMQLQDDAQKTAGPSTLADAWIQARLAQVTRSVTDKLETFQFSAAGEELRDFTWGDLADWYLEIAKVEKGKAKILEDILSTILKLWHPFMPFVTEYIWGLMGNKDLIVAEWPNITNNEELITNNKTDKFETLRTLITDIRRLRSENGVEPAKFIKVACVAEEMTQKLIQENEAVVKQLARLESIDFATAVPQGWPTTVSGVMTIGLDLAGTIDMAAEKAKMQKEIDQLKPYIKTTEAKMADKDFTSKAPEKVVTSMQGKLDEAKAKLAALEQRLKS